jgi:type VI secretion system protein ImpH
VPQLRLGQAGRLGWTTWLGTRTQPGDAEDVILLSTAAA